MLISVIMGIYNCESTLDDAIISILNQTYTDWEFIICDDGSTDNSFFVANKYKELYGNKFVLLRNEKNKGLSYTLNKCLKYAKGTYIARMDGDDISLPQRFEIQLDFLEKHKEYSFVSSGVICLCGNKILKRLKKVGSPLTKLFPKDNPFVHPACMLRKEVYNAVNGYDESNSRVRVEDYDLWIRIYQQGYKGYNMGEPLLLYRDSVNSKLKLKFKYRINEMLVRASAVKKLKLPSCYYVYALRPILVGMLPRKLYLYLHQKRLNHSKL